MSAGVRNIWAIVLKEWHHYFGGAIGYVTLAVWSVIFGWFFNMDLGNFLEESEARPVSLNDGLLRPSFGGTLSIALFVVPLISMRLLAEEKRQGTIELLATSPLTTTQLILGKFFAATGLFALMVLSCLPVLVLVWYYATVSPEWPLVFTCILANLLVGAAFISLGLFVSALTRNQIIAAVVTFCLCLGDWLLFAAGRGNPGPVYSALSYASVINHVEDLLKGVLSLRDLVFYAGFMFFGLFLAHQTVESQRWRA